MQGAANRRLSDSLYALLLIIGLFFIALALRVSVAFFTEYAVGGPFLSLELANQIRSVRLTSLCVGLVMIGLTYALKKNRVLEFLSKNRSLSTRGVLGSLFPLLVSSLMGFVLLDAGLRVLDSSTFWVQTLVSEQENYWHYDELLGWSHVPGAEGRYSGSDFDVYVSINDQGLRDRSYSYQRPDGVSRIVVLGDSYTWGFGVEQEQVVTELIEESHDNLQVINMGVSGYSTDQEYLLLREEGLRYDPQLILLMLFENDIYHNPLDVNYLKYPKPRFSVVDGELVLASRPSPSIGPLREIHCFLRTHSVTYNYLVRVFESGQAPWIRFSRSFGSGVSLWLTGRRWEDPVELTSAIIGEMRDLSEAAGAQLVVVQVASQGQALGLERTIPDELIEYCRAEDIPFLDLVEPFKDYLAAHSGQSLQFAHDPHWNADGHKLAADAIGSYLQTKAW